ncbi:sugar ABC transporter substrate-binding protein [Kribbella sp. VKM Ac-2566]|uniref:ABC transporter substrate-binding protein n=1 Tax=Kribbella sp. VKM Ac-2566 TaxID=2512218 RepID=UPI0010639D72|nr:sugar ABC transporter substrate-binding protein [Kribbella sp. VKM Ac-2566]TDW79565.1 multiple sugar transport system substrate-binding protein [Kribbella sp. VKM Ac-2566]
MNGSARISRRRLLGGASAVVGGAAAGGLLSGCNANSSGSSAGNGGGGGGSTVTLTVMYNNNELTKDHIADFEAKNPGIRINFLQTDATRLNAMLASGTPPDFVRGAAVGSANVNARGLATDLTPYLEKSQVLKKDDLLGVNDSFRWDGSKIGQGSYYGIVKDWSQDATLWYNAQLFDQAKTPHLSETEPIGYDDLLAVGKKLTSRQGGKTKVYGLGVEWAWNLFAPLATMILQQGGQIYNGDLTETDFTSAAARRAVAWYVDFAQAGVGPSSLDPLPDGADLSTFMAKRMAISQDGYWYGGNFVKETALHPVIRMAPAPVMGDHRVSPTYAGMGAWIPAKSKHKDEAWKLMEYFMAGPPAEERAKSGWGLPALKSLLPKLPQDLPYQKQAYKTAQNELQFSAPLPDSPYATVDTWNLTLDKHLQRAIKKQATVDAACKAITDDVNKVLKQGKEQIG